jgi:hypothetical protein
MTPKQKAEELFDKMNRWQVHNQDQNIPIDNIESTRKTYAKGAAIVCVDELIESSKSSDATDGDQYWLEVKKEIDNL